MRQLFTTSMATARGTTPSELRWGERSGRWRRIARGVYGMGSEEPSPLDRARSMALVTGGVASGRLAAVALLDLAPTVDDLVWEQALESALRRSLTTVDELEQALSRPRRAHGPGPDRVRRVLALRPPGSPPTDSLLETLMVQLARNVPGLGPPVRQLEIRTQNGIFLARVDLAWPDLGLFIELDGQHHKGQPVYDASRETAVVANTGWLCGRFTWTEVVRVPTSTARRLAQLVDQARRRPVVMPARS